MFCGYIVALIPFKAEETLCSIISTTVLDISAIGIIFYFVLVRHKQKLLALGLSGKNFLKNVICGIAGYVAIVPILVLVLLTIVWIISILKYEPPPQPVLEMFVEEEKTPILVYLTIFVAILGPIAEEIFFRGFVYSAIKKRMGLVWAVLLSSVLFAGLHAHLVGFFPIVVLGILLAYLYEKSGSLIPSITVHVIHNSAMIFLVFLMKEVYF